MRKKLLSFFLTIVVVLSSIGMRNSKAYGTFQAGKSITLTTTEGWQTDFNGNLVPDQEGYYVLTITKDMIENDQVTLNLNPFASLFLSEFRNVSSARSEKKLKIINESEAAIQFMDYEFTTENELPRTTNYFSPGSGSFVMGLGRVLGSAYQEMASTITSKIYRTDRTINVLGFDGKPINLMLLNLRTLNHAVADFYRRENPYDLNLQEMMAFDQDLKRAGYDSYGSYLKSYYGVNSLMDLDLKTTYHILGTGNGAQSAINQWEDATPTGRALPKEALAQLTPDFKIWGLMGLNIDPSDQEEYPYGSSYFMLETDKEVIQFAYEYLYTNGLRFTFDDQKHPYDKTDEYYGVGGAFGIKAYIDKNKETTDYIIDSLGKEVLLQGETLKLDHVSAGLYVPNAWNQHRMYDFGISLTYKVKDSGLYPPKTGDDFNLGLWVTLLSGSFLGFVGIVFYYFRKVRKESEETALKKDLSKGLKQ